jgi:hypothetical protein
MPRRYPVKRAFELEVFLLIGGDRHASQQQLVKLLSKDDMPSSFGVSGSVDGPAF